MKGSGIKDRKRMSQVAVLKTKNCKPNPKGGFRQTDVGKDCRRKSGNGTCQARGQRKTAWTVSISEAR